MATEENEEVPKLPADTRLDSLEQRLERVQRIEAERTHKGQPDPNYRTGQLVLSHLIGAPIGGGVIGWGLDTLFGTFPWLMLVMLFVGFGVGIRNVLKIANTPPGTRPGKDS